MGRVDHSFLRYFNRDPKRVVPKHDNVIVSPADGWIKTVLESGTKYTIVIGMRVYDVHVNYVPISGKILSVEENGIKFADLSYKEWQLHYTGIGEFDCFQKITTLDTEIGIVTVRQITSWWAKRIQVYHEAGEQVDIGDKLGRILLGSTVVLEIPKISRRTGQKMKVLVESADQSRPIDELDTVIGSETIIARY